MGEEETTRDKRSVVAISFKFLQELPSKLEIQCKKGMYFSFDFAWYFINLDIIRSEQVGRRREGWLNSETKSVR